MVRLMHITGLERLTGRPGDVFGLDASFAFWSASSFLGYQFDNGSLLKRQSSCSSVSTDKRRCT